MPSTRDFLIRGLLAGLVAGVVAFGVAFVVGEPSVDAAISLEESGAAEHSHHEGADSTAPAHSHGEDEAVVPRSLQSTAGLLTGTVAAGVTLGGLVGVLSALALGRFGRTGARATTLAVAAAGFVAVYVMPSLAYPPNPPAVGSADTIGYRTALFFILMAISVIALVAAVLVGRRLALRWGGWYATIAAVLGYLVVTVAVMALLPSYNEVPDSFPATVLFEFRRASFLTQLVLWAVLGVVLADSIGRLTDRARPPAAVRSQPVAAR
jgi:predicted cobalt transporter CbtA